MAQVTQRIHSSDFEARLANDLKRLLPSKIRYEFEIKVFLPYSVSIEYLNGKYRMVFELTIGMLEDEYQKTLTYVTKYVAEMEEELEYKKGATGESPKREPVREATPHAYPRSQQPIFDPFKAVEERELRTEDEQAALLNNRGYELAGAGNWMEAIP